MAEGGATITPSLNGPYRIRGNFTLVDVDGKEWKIEGEQIALCRCGQSSNKPFCDGTHRSCGFASEVRAPAE
jgi:CDGSH-type Zn-finger protein